MMMRRGIQSRLGRVSTTTTTTTRSMVGHSTGAAVASAWDTPSWGTDNVVADPSTNVWGSGSGRGNGGVQFWGGQADNEQWQKLNSAPTDVKTSRALTPQAVLMTVREDPGMTTTYYARRYFGGATPTTIATLNHIFWSQLKKFGKVTISREPGKEDDPEGLLWMPMRRERGRLTNVKKHRPETEDLSLLKDYVEAPSFDQVPAEARPQRVPFHHRGIDPAILEQRDRYYATMEAQGVVEGTPEHKELHAAFWGQGVPLDGVPAKYATSGSGGGDGGSQQSAQGGGGGGGVSQGGSNGGGGGVEGGSETDRLAPISISNDLKATVETVMKQLLSAIHAEPNMTMNHYTNHHLKTDEHRLASSSAFKELQHKNLITKQRTITPSDDAVEGSNGKRGIGTTGATFAITEEGEQVLHSL